MFEWFRGGAKEVAQQADEPDVVDEDDLPFPLSILENTHLRGTCPSFVTASLDAKITQRHVPKQSHSIFLHVMPSTCMLLHLEHVSIY